MQRHNNLFGQVTSFSTLLLASRKTRKGKRFKKSTALFEFNLEKELLTLQEELKNHTYKPGTYREFNIYDPKPRKISAAPYRDRVVQHALCHVIEPIFEKSFIFDTYACRKGKGTHAAVDKFTKYARKFQYVLTMDMKKYFPSIDHEILRDKISRKIKCKDTLWLIDLIINSWVNNTENDTFYRRKGIPIGNLTSQLFANLYLNGLDHLVKEKMSEFGYIRYMDDITLFGNDKKSIWEAKEKIESFVNMERLNLKTEKTVIYPVNVGVNYLGYKIFPDYRKVKYENVVKCKKRMKLLSSQYSKGNVGLEQARNSIQSWISHVRHADSWHLRESIFSKYSLIKGQA